MYFHFFLLVNHDVYIHLFLVAFNTFFKNVDFSILKSFIVKVSFDDNLGTVNQVRSNLATLGQTELGFQIFSIAFLYAMIMDIRNTWTLCKYNLQEDLITYNLFCFDSDIREQAMSPITFDGSCNIIARDGNGLAYRQSGESYKYVVLIVFDTFHFDTTDFILLRSSRVENNRAIVFFCGDFLCVPCAAEAEQAC